MVVVVLTISCQVSLKPNNGPLSAHATIASTATTNTTGRPASAAIRRAIRENLKLFMDRSGK